MLTSNAPREAFIALFLIAFCGALPLFVLPALGNRLAADLTFDLTWIGTVSAIQFGLCAGMAIGASWLQEHFGLRACISGSLLCGAAGNLMLAASRNSPEFLVGFVLVASIQSSVPFLSLMAVASRFPLAQQSAASSTITSATFAAIGVGIPVLIALTEATASGWRHAFVAQGGIQLVALACSLRWLANDPRGTLSVPVTFSRLSWIRLLEIAPYMRLLWCTIAARIGAGMYLTFAPSFITEVKGLPRIDLVWTYSVPGLLAFLAAPFVARLISPAPTPMIFHGATVALVGAVLLICFSPTSAASVLPMMLALCILYTIAESVRTSSLHTLVLRALPVELSSRSLALYTAGLYAGYALGSLLGGLLLRTLPGLLGIHQAMQAFPIVISIVAGIWLVASFTIHNNLRLPQLVRHG